MRGMQFKKELEQLALGVQDACVTGHAPHD